MIKKKKILKTRCRNQAKIRFFKEAREKDAIQIALFVGCKEKGTTYIIQKIFLHYLVRPLKLQLINAPSSALLQ